MLAVFALAFWIAHFAEERIKAGEGTRMAEIARQMAINLDRDLYHRKQDVLFYSTLPKFREKWDSSEKRALLNQIQKNKPVFTWLGITDKNGTIIAGSGGLLEGVNVAQRDYFVQGRNGFFAGDVHDALLLSKVLPRAKPDPLPLRLVDLAAPLYDMSGKFIGILITHMSMEWAAQIRDELLVGQKNLDLLVLKKDGQILVGPSNDFVLNASPQDRETIRQRSLDPNPYSIATWSDGDFLTGKAHSEPYGDFEGFGWQVMVREPAAVAFDEGRQLRSRILSFGSLAIMFMGILGWRLVGYVVRPLRQIAAAAEQIQQGDESIAIPLIKGQDEAATLSASLSRLVTGLRSTHQELDAKVAEQAATLDHVRKLSQAVEQNPNSIVITALDRTIEYVNQAFVDSTGFSPDDVIGQNPRILQSGKTPASTYEDLWATLTSGHTWKGELINRRKNGEEYPVLAWISPVRQADGRITHYLASEEDITERKRLEVDLESHRTKLEQLVEARTQALHESENRIRLVLESAAEAIYGTDIHGACTFCNPACLKALGYQHADELIGKNMHDLIHHTHPDGSPFPVEACRIYNSFREGKPEHVVGELFWRNDGSSFPVEYWAHPQFKNGVAAGSVVTFFDITERKQAEQALIAARNAAELANRAKDSFLATMSHEIRTPLGGLMGMLELLSLSPLGPEQAETLATARDSGRSLLRILNDILDWSKIEEGKLELALQATSIAALVAEVANTYSHVASGNSVTLTPRIDARLSPAHLLDPLRLSQVLNNFVSNAIKFSHGGRVELQAELIERREGAEGVRFSVKDTGIGIAPEVQRRLFQDYGQASADTARMYGGTGLGLAICRRLADLMDARIDLESQPGRGSTFSITLMLPVEETVAESRQAPAKLGIGTAAFAPPLLAGIAAADAPQVLVVDDHPTNRKLLARQLGLLGLRAETAENGAAALTLWRAGRYALVITDCHMPLMDGYALTRAIREIEVDEARSRTPVFAWTANALADEIENCRAAGMDELLVKPADLVQLKTVLAKWLPAVAAPESAAVPPAPTFAVKHGPPSPPAPLPQGERGVKAPPPSRGRGWGEGAQGVASSAALDVSVLAALVGDDPAVIREFLLDFRASAASIAAQLAAACAAGQAAQAEALAHKLKSSARAVGALALGELCAELETAGKTGQAAALSGVWPRFEAEMAAVDATLADLTAHDREAGEQP